MVEELEVVGPKFYIKTRAKSILDFVDFHSWMNNNMIMYTYIGNGTFCIYGEEHATIVKLVWGA
jgi:hypothetical protein